MQIVERLKKLRRAEHESTVEIVALLVSLYESRAYLDLGYGSIWDFLVRELNYSAGAASRRYKAMQCARRFPVVLEMLRDHRTSLCALAKAEATLATACNAEELLGLIEGKSAREVEQVVARERPVKPKRERVRRVVVQPAATMFAEEDAPREERVWISFTITPEQEKLLEEAKARMSSKLGGGAKLQDVFVELLQAYLKPKKRRKNKEQPTKRRIPAAVREEVHRRDGGRCVFVSAEGRRCGSTHQLQIDHIRPWALGGSSELSNLRLLCAQHNRHLARKSFGTVPTWNSNPSTPPPASASARSAPRP